MNINKKNHIAVLLSLILALVAFTACTLDDIEGPGYVKEGEPATVNLKIDLDEISVKTRADMDPDLENRVESLWVAIYNARTGERTFSNTYTPNGDFPEPTTGTLNDIKTTSGNSYIVAVANYKNKTALDLNNNYGEGKDHEYDLETLLANADTWDKYRAVAIKRELSGGNIHVEVPAEAIVMQGSYRASGHQTDYTEDEGAEIVGIQPGNNNLIGIIHLRRIWTQNKFTIKPSDNIISMELVNMEVINVPVLSWLHGRSQNSGEGVLGYANAGDSYSPEMPSDLNHGMYRNSLTYTPTSMTVTTDDKGRPNYAFDYWQYENKRTGNYADKYEDREKEFKNADGTNSGIYTSLCGDSGDATLDNNATFIRFKARIRYIVDNITSPDAIKDEVGKVTYRNAEVTYVVHLGYIKNNAKDFNCYRNSRYTYNITVKSVDQVLLEAYREGENQPGAEGAVTDVTDEFFDLDAHFNIFNVYLTKSELEGFTFSMTTYENGIPHRITNITDPSINSVANVPDRNNTDWKYYSWIQLIENGNTEEKSKIAPFPDITNETNKNKILYLDDIKGKANSLKAGEGICFTVYVKEYTYEAEYGEKDYGNEKGTQWTRYVNQPSRTANFNVAYKVSADGESQHFKAKYALSQRSIQTYYDISKATAGDGTALGVEHMNETFGMNIRWTKDKPSAGYDKDNGRYNVWIAAGGSDKGKQAGSWTATDILDLDNLLYINKVENIKQTQYATHLKNAFNGGTRYLPAMNTITSGLTSTAGGFNSVATQYDPQPGSNAQYIQAIYSCMNRNKDENGNGKIDAEELKWYLPASGKYLRVILGRNNLVTPIMAYEQETLPEACGTGHNTMYHYITSDRKIVWADEGISSSEFNDDKSKWQVAPWQLRCIRNLGTNLTTVTEGEKVTAAYDDKDVNTTTGGGVIKPVRYYATALRNPTTFPLPIHKTSSAYNRIALYGFEIAPAGNLNTTDYSYEAGMQNITYNTSGSTPNNVSTISKTYTAIKNAVESASPCEKLNKTTGRTGWRLPNQKEIVIIMRAGLIRTAGYYNYKLTNSWWEGYYVSVESNNGWGNAPGMMCCTVEHWQGIDESGDPLPGIVKAVDELSYANRWTTIEPSHNIATAKKHGGIEGIRCVRDLTAAEAGKTYTQIYNNR